MRLHTRAHAVVNTRIESGHEPRAPPSHLLICQSQAAVLVPRSWPACGRRPWRREASADALLAHLDTKLRIGFASIARRDRQQLPTNTPHQRSDVAAVRLNQNNLSPPL